MGFDILIVVSIKMMVLCDLLPYRLVVSYKRFKCSTNVSVEQTSLTKEAADSPQQWYLRNLQSEMFLRKGNIF